MRENTNITLKAFDVDGGFTVLVYDYTDERNNEDLWGAFLVKKNYGIADFMFGVPKSQTTYDEFLELVESNLDDEIEAYRTMAYEDYGDEI